MPAYSHPASSHPARNQLTASTRPAAPLLMAAPGDTCPATFTRPHLSGYGARAPSPNAKAPHRLPAGAFLQSSYITICWGSTARNGGAALGPAAALAERTPGF